MKKHERIIYFFFFLVIIISVDARSFSNLNPRSKVNSSLSTFDGLVFMQKWPRASCIEMKNKRPESACLLPVHNNWTIHGLWPSLKNKHGPDFCTAKSTFNITALASIERELQIKWTDLYNNKSGHSFWKHEWDKHGSCGTTHEELNSLFKYFQKALELFDRYNMKNILENANILPGGSYQREKIITGINNVLGKHARVTCFWDKINKESYLHEISVCLDKSSLELIDCDGIGKNSLTNCKSNMNVTYIGIPQNKCG